MSLDTQGMVLFVVLGVMGLAEMGYLLYRITRRSQQHSRYLDDLKTLYRTLERNRNRVPEDHYQKQMQVFEKYSLNVEEDSP